MQWNYYVFIGLAIAALVVWLILALEDKDGAS